MSADERFGTICRLRVIPPVGRPFEVPLTGRRFRIGRGQRCDLRLEDPRISREHLILQRQGRTWVGEDVSRHGVRRNGLPWSGTQVLEPGDRVQIAGFVLELAEPAEASGSLTLLPGRAGDFHGLIGRSRAMQALYDRIERFAASHLPVLIRGETGTGKERVAAALHACSGRRRWEELNCGAIPTGTASSALFGHVRGAFTGAERRHQGPFERADGGTVFLDEIGELPAEQQAALLRVLEVGRVLPVGGEAPVDVRFRLLSATHRDLERLAQTGDFRQDLIFRLRGVELVVPPLRDRPDDVLPLAALFLAAQGVPAERLSDSARSALRGHPWPGNVRELKHAMERAVLFADGGAIGPEHRHLERQLGRPLGPSAEAPRRRGWDGELSMRPRDAIVAALDRHRGNRAGAARELGIARSTLYERMERLGLKAVPE